MANKTKEELEEILRKAQMDVEDFLLENNIGEPHKLQDIWRSIESLWRQDRRPMDYSVWDKFTGLG